MYDDYLKKYREDYPKVNIFPTANRMLNQKQKKHSKNQQGRNSMAQNTIRNKKYNKTNKAYFKELNIYTGRVHKGSNNILESMKKMLTFIFIAGAALFGISKTLEAKEKSYNPEYAPEGTAPTPTGKYEGTDDKTRLKNKIIDEAKRQGVKPEQALALAHWETRGRFNTDAYNPVSKAAGIFQVTPIAAEQVGIDYNAMRKDEDLQIKAGVAYLKWLLPQFNGDFKKAAGAYNWGIGNVKTKGIENAPKETRDYILEAPKLEQQYKQELSQLKTETPIIKGFGAGEKRKYYTQSSLNGKNPTIGNYTLWNPNTARGYIELSERAETYLKDVGGSGIVTSGSEGAHAVGELSHGSGNKVDIIARNNTKESWANSAIPFLKNKNTAFVVFEGFTRTEFLEIQKIIYSKIDINLKKLCESKARQAGWGSLGGKYLDYADDDKSMKNGKHLDIGILTNAYSKNQYKEEQKKIKESTPVNIQKAKDNNEQIKKEEKRVKGEVISPTQTKPVNTSLNIKGNQPKQSQPMQNVGQQGITEQIKQLNKSYVNGRK